MLQLSMFRLRGHHHHHRRRDRRRCRHCHRRRHYRHRHRHTFATNRRQRHHVFGSSVRPSVARSLTPISYDLMSPYSVEGFQRN